MQRARNPARWHLGKRVLKKSDFQALPEGSEGAEGQPAPSEDGLFGNTLRLLQPRTGHRAGTDAVLLAATTPPASRMIADLGAASGVIGLRAAQINRQASVCLFEREEGLAALAAQNIVLNSLEGRVTVELADVLSLAKNPAFRERFDCVLTNPPFFEARQIRVSGNPMRARAHVLDGSLDDWLRNAVAILAPRGTLHIIHRADAIEGVLEAVRRRVGGVKIRFVHPAADVPAIRVLLAGTKGSRARLTILPPLVLHGAAQTFLPEASEVHAGSARINLMA
jgi:tRNA1(Val) A37 N6-methylase TrmN6